MLHGFLDTSETFQFLADHLPAELDLVSFDQRGFGSSSWSGNYHFPEYVADLHAMLNILAPDREIILIGHSLGANVASIYTAIRARRIRCLINLEGIFPTSDGDADVWARHARWLEGQEADVEWRPKESIRPFVKAMLRNFPGIGSDRAEFLCRTRTRVDDAGRFLPNADPRHQLVNPVAYQGGDIERLWQLISVPAMLVLGGRSEYAEQGMDIADLWKKSVSFGRCERVSKGSHMLHCEYPEILVEMIEDFIRFG